METNCQNKSELYKYNAWKKCYSNLQKLNTHWLSLLLEKSKERITFLERINVSNKPKESRVQEV